MFNVVYFGADHRGYPLKESLKSFLDQRKIRYVDLGAFSEESVDYPTFAREVAEKVLENPDSGGILICNTGIGVCIAANRYKGIRAALCFDRDMAEYSRKHNNANVLCLGSEKIDPLLAQEMVDIFLHTDFEGGRHERRVQMLDTL